MLRILPCLMVLSLSAGPAFAGVPVPTLPTGGLLGIAAAAVIAAIFLAKRKR